MCTDMPILRMLLRGIIKLCLGTMPRAVNKDNFVYTTKCSISSRAIALALETCDIIWITLPRVNAMSEIQPKTVDFTQENEVLQILPRPYYFSRLFKQSMGVSPYQYIVQQRIERAKYLLRTTSLSVAAIALQVGFSH